MKSALHFLSHDKKLSCNQGELIPVGLLEVLPGDKIDHAISALVRTSPLVTPVMHECEVKFHSWFVPTRLIWDEWEDFITGGEDGLQAPVAPTIAAPTGGWLIGSLGDYLGLPTGVQYSSATSALPFRAYQLIYNNWYRDEQLQTPATFSTASGVDVTTSRSLQNGCWDKDRFTSARPQPQLGAEVVIPLTGDAPIKGDATRSAAGTTGSFSVLDVNNAVSDLATDGALAYPKNTAVGTGHPLYADLSQVSAVDVEDLREASAMQRFLENMNNFGSRYIERLQSAFGVNPQDGRLQLPEYLGGGTQKIQFSEVLQTAEGTDPVGEMKGHGISAQRTNRYRRYIPEHGYILTLMIVRPKTQYVQGIPKLWSRSTKYDYFQPEFQHLGDQPVLNKEVYAAHATPNGVFGYQNYGDDYRFVESTIAGEFRDTLKDWHMARIFTSDPALNSTFVTANPTTRIYADTASDQLYVNVKHRIKARRCVMKHAQPMLF